MITFYRCRKIQVNHPVDKKKAAAFYTAAGTIRGQII